MRILGVHPRPDQAPRNTMKIIGCLRARSSATGARTSQVVERTKAATTSSTCWSLRSALIGRLMTCVARAIRSPAWVSASHSFCIGGLPMQRLRIVYGGRDAAAPSCSPARHRGSSTSTVYCAQTLVRSGLHRQQPHLGAAGPKQRGVVIADLDAPRHLPVEARQLGQQRSRTAACPCARRRRCACGGSGRSGRARGSRAGLRQRRRRR